MTIALTACTMMASHICLPDYRPPAPKTVTDYPALMVIYDPSLGGLNCDGDCSTVATGQLTADMWFTSGACHPELLGATVRFPAIDFTMRCVDTGPAVTVAYNDYYRTDVVYLDAMWKANQPPDWLYWLLEDWAVVAWSE